MKKRFYATWFVEPGLLKHIFQQMSLFHPLPYKGPDLKFSLGCIFVCLLARNLLLNNWKCLTWCAQAKKLQIQNTTTAFHLFTFFISKSYTQRRIFLEYNKVDVSNLSCFIKNTFFFMTSNRLRKLETSFQIESIVLIENKVFVATRRHNWFLFKTL